MIATFEYTEYHYLVSRKDPDNPGGSTLNEPILHAPAEERLRKVAAKRGANVVIFVQQAKDKVEMCPTDEPTDQNECADRVARGVFAIRR